MEALKKPMGTDLVPGARVELARALSPGDFESPASADSATPAPNGACNYNTHQSDFQHNGQRSAKLNRCPAGAREGSKALTGRSLYLLTSLLCATNLPIEHQSRLVWLQSNGDFLVGTSEQTFVDASEILQRATCGVACS